ncbi:hypothetical protein [Cohnella cellulosilytica]|uniref:Resolvase/invertase-type recombinase catalytic domain-containing protein n=1 Tax=Cohnella cellulosilytica TaxID=986710 RepID=A0ABW2F5U5_9BACL
MNEEAIEILKALKTGQELLIAKIDGIDVRLAKLVDLLSVRTTRLQAKL